MRISKERLQLAREFIDQYEKLQRQGADVIGWLALKFNCNRRHAQELYDAVVKTRPADPEKK